MPGPLGGLDFRTLIQRFLEAARSPAPFGGSTPARSGPSGRQLMGWTPEQEAISNPSVPPPLPDIAMPSAPASPRRDFSSRGARPVESGLDLGSDVQPASRTKPAAAASASVAKPRPRTRGPVSSRKLPPALPPDIPDLPLDPGMLPGGLSGPEAAPALPPLYSQPTLGYMDTAVPGLAGGDIPPQHKRNALLHALGKIIRR